MSSTLEKIAAIEAEVRGLRVIYFLLTQNVFFRFFLYLDG